MVHAIFLRRTFSDCQIKNEKQNPQLIFKPVRNIVLQRIPLIGNSVTVPDIWEAQSFLLFVPNNKQIIQREIQKKTFQIFN